MGSCCSQPSSDLAELQLVVNDAAGHPSSAGVCSVVAASTSSGSTSSASHSDLSLASAPEHATLVMGFSPAEMEEASRRGGIPQDLLVRLLLRGEELGFASNWRALTTRAEGLECLIASGKQMILRSLTTLDEDIIALLRSSSIKLLCAERIRRGDLERILRRQDLEAMEISMEASSGQRIFLSPDEAADAFARGTREVGVLTYGWNTPDEPDPTGTILQRIRHFLRGPLGKSITAIFWDFPSLHQKPRTPEEDKAFGQALDRMGDLYASVTGVTVMRHRAIPPRPTSYDGRMLVIPPSEFPSDAGAVSAQLGLADHGTVASLHHDARKRRWAVRYETHEQASAAVLALGTRLAPTGGAVFLEWNARAYADRGWTTFETAVSTEAMARVAFYPNQKAVLDGLPPKLIEIDGEIDGAEAVVALAADYAPDADATRRVARMRASINEATFTGSGDKQVVVRLYNDYVVRMSSAFNTIGGMQTTFEGPYNATAAWQGTMHFADGGVYEGQLVGEKREGHGTMTFADGSSYTGEWAVDKWHGQGTHRDANGDTYVGQHVEERREGAGRFTNAFGDLFVGQFKEGHPEGHGVSRYANGSVYEGEYRDSKFDGQGTYTHPSGVVYNGGFRAGLFEGRGTYRFGDGGRLLGCFRANEHVGQGARWSADGQTAWVVYDGEQREEVSLDEALLIAELVSDSPAEGTEDQIARLQGEIARLQEELARQLSSEKTQSAEESEETNDSETEEQ